MNHSQQKIYLEHKNLTDLELCKKYIAVVATIPQETFGNLESYTLEQKDHRTAFITLLGERDITSSQAFELLKNPEQRMEKAKEILSDILFTALRNLGIGTMLFFLGYVLSSGTPYLFYGALLMGVVLFAMGLFELVTYLKLKREYRLHK